MNLFYWGLFENARLKRPLKPTPNNARGSGPEPVLAAAAVTTWSALWHIPAFQKC